MKVLVGAECSGVVREAFRLRGHDAYSCDILPAMDNSPYHIQADVRLVLSDGWDLGIFHLPCTYFCNSSVRWFTTIPKTRKPGVLYGPERWQAFYEAADLWADVVAAPIPRIAMENPIPHGAMTKLFGMYDQIVQPWMFGHGEIKRTCLWLKALPKLIPTKIVSGRRPRVHHESPGPDRWLKRSITYQGLADAMAAQWGAI